MRPIGYAPGRRCRSRRLTRQNTRATSHGAPPARFTASCSSSQLLTHPKWRAFSLAASQARLRNSLKVIEASGSSEYSSIASQGAFCLRYFALKQVPRRATRMQEPSTSILRFEWIIYSSPAPTYAPLFVAGLTEKILAQSRPLHGRRWIFHCLRNRSALGRSVSTLLIYVGSSYVANHVGPGA